MSDYTVRVLKKMGACEDGRESAREFETMGEWWAQSDNLSWMLWLCDKLGLCGGPAMRLFMVSCARRVQDDTTRPLLDVVERFAAGAASGGELSAAWSAAESAARSAAEPAARSAAESAARSAAEPAARYAAWYAAWSAARYAAESAALYAARSAAESAEEYAARYAAESAQRDTLRSIFPSSQIDRLFAIKAKELGL